MVIGNDVFTDSHPAYPLNRTLSVAYKHNQIYVYFILKLLIISDIACVINSPCTSTYYLDMWNFDLESGLSYLEF